MVLNPVRARMVASPGDWPWSSYGACVQDQFAPSWLDTDWLLGQFGAQRSRARRAFAKFVVQGKIKGVRVDIFTAHAPLRAA